MALILVIDDEVQSREMRRELLEHDGHQVETAGDGSEGIELYRRNPADLVITDIIMPKKEGVETILDLRQEFPDVKIIAMSGGGTVGPETYLKIATGFGAARVFAKPFKTGELLAAVKELLE